VSLLAAEHVWALIAIALAGAGLCLAARLWPGRWTTLAARALGIGILAVEASWWIVWLPLRGNWSPAFALPLQLCDLAAFIAGIALLWPRPILDELTYFWGLGGTLQALLTPDLEEHFPSYPYWQFYLAHGGVIVAALFLVVGLRRTPRPVAVARVFGITLALAVLDALVDLATGANYLYLRHPPLNTSLLDYMGPWPWYVLTGAVLALALLLVLDAPFRLIARRPRTPAAC
jgi:hypothetical integral membrane protein (TIGR02206 family)